MPRLEAVELIIAVLVSRKERLRTVSNCRKAAIWNSWPSTSGGRNQEVLGPGTVAPLENVGREHDDCWAATGHFGFDSGVSIKTQAQAQTQTLLPKLPLILFLHCPGRLW